MKDYFEASRKVAAEIAHLEVLCSCVSATAQSAPIIGGGNMAKKQGPHPITFHGKYVANLTLNKEETMKKQIESWLLILLVAVFAGCGTTDPYTNDDLDSSSSVAVERPRAILNSSSSVATESSSGITENSSATLKTRAVPYEQVKVTKECSEMALSIADIRKKYKEYYEEWVSLACVGERIGDACVSYDTDLTLNKTVCRNSYEDDVECTVTYMFRSGNASGGGPDVIYEDKNGKLDSAAVVHMIALKYPSAKLDAIRGYCTQTYLD